jgi:hypothetical protein
MFQFTTPADFPEIRNIPAYIEILTHNIRSNRNPTSSGINVNPYAGFPSNYRYQYSTPPLQSLTHGMELFFMIIRLKIVLLSEHKLCISAHVEERMRLLFN